MSSTKVSLFYPFQNRIPIDGFAHLFYDDLIVFSYLSASLRFKMISFAAAVFLSVAAAETDLVT